MTLAAIAAKLAEEQAPPPAPAARIGLAWYVVQTSPNCERRAERGIKERLGFQTFLPIERKWVRHARRKTEREYPLFVGYLFVAFDIRRDPWTSIYSETSQRLYGVDRILSNGNRPSQVEPHKISDLRQMVKMGLFDETVGGNLKPGSKVTVLSHSQLDLATRIKAVTPDKRAEVVFSLLGRENVVKIPLSKIRPA
jgi:transcriptional antiterminator RfaH